jgi:hypothetical protein
VTFEEVPTSGPVRFLDRTAGYFVTRASIWGRNRASLDRLKGQIEQAVEPLAPGRSDPAPGLSERETG